MGDYFEGQSQATTHHGDVELDPNILACLPQNCRVISCKGHGASNWNQTARLDIETTGDDGTQRRESYFLKLVTGPNGRGMVHGEYESMFLIHETIPKFAARPLAWGACTEPDKHYILFSFHELAPGLPDVDNFAHAVSQLHSLTSGASPNGKFGFHVTTFNGTLPQDNTWTDTWEEFYIRGMRRMFQLEEKAHGPSEELSALVRPFLEVVIPRLLRPMETAGRCIKPVLIHGDLWIGNVSTEPNTKSPIMFDASAFWGHHECKLSTQ
ncbi:hypothetical protein QQX98_004946 [Neonectria punicea]|uniref:protein-ribulosamine 3-kinase n=1 Tax=Neonectria punicea TaxID=979145 RepID=A0ABR1H6Y8_9HYPO